MIAWHALWLPNRWPLKLGSKLLGCRRKVARNDPEIAVGLLTGEVVANTALAPLCVSLYSVSRSEENQYFRNCHHSTIFPNFLNYDRDDIFLGCLSNKFLISKCLYHMFKALIRLYLCCQLSRWKYLHRYVACASVVSLGSTLWT